MTETNRSEVKSSLTIERARELLQQHIARLSAEQYQIGRIFNELLDSRVPGIGSSKSAMKLLGPVIKSLSERDVKRAQAASRRFSEAVFVQYGVRRLGTLVQYGKRLRREWKDGEPGQMLMQVPGEDGHLREKPFPECSPEEVGRAVSDAQEKEASSPLPRLDEYCIHLLREKIRQRFSEDTSTAVRATVREGVTYLTLRDVSMTELRMLAQSILDSIGPLERETYRRSLMPPPRAMPRVAPSLHCVHGTADSATALRAP
jgi:hypothetical protein